MWPPGPPQYTVVKLRVGCSRRLIVQDNEPLAQCFQEPRPQQSDRYWQAGVASNDWGLEDKSRWDPTV